MLKNSGQSDLVPQNPHVHERPSAAHVAWGQSAAEHDLQRIGPAEPRQSMTGTGPAAVGVITAARGMRHCSASFFVDGKVEHVRRNAR
jgi:hypothetical protein